MGIVCLLNYQDTILRFTGYDYGNKKPSDTFYSSCKMKSNGSGEIQWTMKSKNKLKQGINRCGYIIHDHFIVSFGGRVDGSKYIDNIYILDMKHNNGWIQAKHIKCPLPSLYRAIIDSDNNVHLFTQNNPDKVTKHYSMSIKNVLGDLYEDKKDEKNNEDNKRNERDILNAEKRSMQQLIDQLLQNQSVLLKIEALTQGNETYKRDQQNLRAQSQQNQTQFEKEKHDFLY